MGLVVFVILAAAEVVVQVYSGVKASVTTRLWGIKSIAVFLAFMLLALFVLDWGFRYYLLSALLFIWAIIGLAGYLRPRGIDYSRRKIIFPHSP